VRITQGTFSFLDDLTDAEIEMQISYALENGWAIMVEYTDDPHPRNAFWDMWNQPEFDLAPDEADVAMRDIHACREAYPNHYIKVVCYDSSLGRQTSRLSFIVNRPDEEPGFRLERQEKANRRSSRMPTCTRSGFATATGAISPALAIRRRCRMPRRAETRRSAAMAHHPIAAPPRLPTKASASPSVRPWPRHNGPATGPAG
jgi:ribulose-bisphosphate carboxylase small chain